jgi:heme exporter protein D
MYFDDLNAFFAMGGYGFYVWLSFGLGFLSLTIIWLDSLLTKRRLLADVLVEQERQLRIKAASDKQANTAKNKERHV